MRINHSLFTMSLRKSAWILRRQTEKEESLCWSMPLRNSPVSSIWGVRWYNRQRVSKDQSWGLLTVFDISTMTFPRPELFLYQLIPVSSLFQRLCNAKYNTDLVHIWSKLRRRNSKFNKTKRNKASKVSKSDMLCPSYQSKGGIPGTRIIGFS